jgi:hypothetical protein
LNRLPKCEDTRLTSAATSRNAPECASGGAARQLLMPVASSRQSRYVTGRRARRARTQHPAPVAEHVEAAGRRRRYRRRAGCVALAATAGITAVTGVVTSAGDMGISSAVTSGPATGSAEPPVIPYQREIMRDGDVAPPEQPQDFPGNPDPSLRLPRETRNWSAPPADRAGLRVTIEDSSVRPDHHFIVRIANPTDVAISLSPCPACTLTAGNSYPSGTGTWYRLDTDRVPCDRLPASLEPGDTVRLDMRLEDDSSPTATGLWSPGTEITWSIAGPAVATGRL